MNEEIGEISRCYTITFDRHSRHSARRLWSAITDPREIGGWMGYPARVDLRLGGEWHVDFSRTNQGELPGVIVRIEPERVLTYVWGLSVVEWTLQAQPDGCRYRFVHAGLADRGVDADDEGLPAGWHDFLDQLDHHLAWRTPHRGRAQSELASPEALLSRAARPRARAAPRERLGRQSRRSRRSSVDGLTRCRAGLRLPAAPC